MVSDQCSSCGSCSTISLLNSKESGTFRLQYYHGLLTAWWYVATIVGRREGVWVCSIPYECNSSLPWYMRCELLITHVATHTCSPDLPFVWERKNGRAHPTWKVNLHMFPTKHEAGFRTETLNIMRDHKHISIHVHSTMCDNSLYCYIRLRCT